MNFGGEVSYANMADGWAKINKFNVDATGVRWSSKFLATQTYKECMAAEELLPQMTMGPVKPDNWGIGDLADITAHTDNTIVTVTKMGNDFIAATDLPKVNIFDPATLEWVEYIDQSDGKATMSTAHFVPEPGTDNILNYWVKGIPGVWDTLHLIRYPGGDLHNPQDVGSFHLEYETMIHQFSVTEHYAIFMLYPINIDFVCATANLLHNMLECVRWFGDKTDAQIHIFNLETGAHTGPIKTDGVYSTHHINAYESNENDLETIVMDVVIPPWYALKNFTDKDSMLNTPDTGANENLFKITRYQIDVKNRHVFSSDWKDAFPGAQPFYNQFDFPKVNPNYYGYSYCYAYGQALVENYRQYLVKKNLCTTDHEIQDKIWYKENHYSGEPMFIPRPGATEEDDGVVMVIVLDGTTELSYLMLLDGQTFETIAEARMDTHIPMSIHGTWVDEIY